MWWSKDFFQRMKDGANFGAFAGLALGSVLAISGIHKVLNGDARGWQRVLVGIGFAILMVFASKALTKWHEMMDRVARGKRIDP